MAAQAASKVNVSAACIRSLEVVGIVLMAASFGVAAAAGFTALGLFRGARGAETEGSPPAGRVYFLAIVGMTVTVLFVFTFTSRSCDRMFFVPSRSVRRTWNIILLAERRKAVASEMTLLCTP